MRAPALPVLAILLAGAPALGDRGAPSIFLNGVKLEGTDTRSLSLSAVDVRFDERGDLYIVAKGYRVSVVPAGPAPSSPANPSGLRSPAAPGSVALPPAPLAPANPGKPPVAQAPAPAPAPPPALGKRIFIVPAPQPRVGFAQWDIEVLVNGESAHRFRSREPEPMVEITRFLKPGDNRIHFAARKEPGERISTSPADTFELSLEEGEQHEGKLAMTRLHTYRRNASEVGAYEAEIVIELSR